jgi:hypothetical protein
LIVFVINPSLSAPLDVFITYLPYIPTMNAGGYSLTLPSSRDESAEAESDCTRETGASSWGVSNGEGYSEEVDYG